MKIVVTDAMTGWGNDGHLIFSTFPSYPHTVVMEEWWKLQELSTLSSRIRGVSECWVPVPGLRRRDKLSIKDIQGISNMSQNDLLLLSLHTHKSSSIHKRDCAWALYTIVQVNKKVHFHISNLQSIWAVTQIPGTLIIINKKCCKLLSLYNNILANVS